MNACRSCGAEIEGPACTYCGTPAAPEPVEAPREGMRACPRCERSIGLAGHAVAGGRVEGCPGCGGVWVASETLESILEADTRPSSPSGPPPAQVSVTGPVQYLRCPDCSRLMARRNYARVSGVIVDSCPDHGIWLDRGELQALREFVATGGRERQREAADKLASDEQRHRERQSRSILQDMRFSSGEGYEGGLGGGWW